MKPGRSPAWDRHVSGPLRPMDRRRSCPLGPVWAALFTACAAFWCGFAALVAALIRN